jgi:1,4-dihydroxy-6-naphthoate synthase
MDRMKIQLAHTPEADDAYMLFGLSSGTVRDDELEIELIEAPLPMLNDRASRGQHELTMLSAATYAMVHRHYQLLGCGASFACGVGPVIVSREPIDPEQLGEKTIAIPGATTTAYAMLQLYEPALRTRILPFDKLLPAVDAGLVDAALVIHEEFVTFRQYGLQVIVDLAQWWTDTHDQLPMPVTCCAARTNLPEAITDRAARLVRQSIVFSRSHHDDAFDHARRYAPKSQPEQLNSFVRQYVSALSEDMGSTGRSALETFYRQAHQAQLLPDPLPLRVLAPPSE